MDQLALTSQDLDWLNEYGEALRLRFNFALQELFPASEQGLKAVAASTPVWFNGQYVRAHDLLAEIEQGTPYSQVFEVWDSRVYGQVLDTCRALDAFDTKVLMVASGYYNRSADEIYAVAAEAHEEAYEALYGAPEDHC